MSIDIEVLCFVCRVSHSKQTTLGAELCTLSVVNGEGVLRLTVGNVTEVVHLSEHLVYQLDSTAAALRYLVEGNFSERPKIPLDRILIGPTASIMLAARCSIGATAFFFAPRTPLNKLLVVDCWACCGVTSSCITLEVDDAIALSDQMFAFAEWIANQIGIYRLNK